MLPHTTQIANSGHTLWQLYHTWAIRSLRKHAGEVMPRHSWHDPNVSPKVTTLPFFCTDDLIPWVQGADLDFADRSPNGEVTFVTFQHLCVWPPVDFNTDPWKWYFCPSMLFSLCLSHPRVPDLQSSPTGAGNFTCFGEPGVGQRCSAPCVEGPDAAARHPVHSKETIFDLPSEIWYFSILGLPFAWNMWKFVATPIPDAPSLDSGSVKTAWHGWRQHDVICGWFGAIMGYLMVLGKVMPRTWRWERSEKERESKSYI